MNRKLNIWFDHGIGKGGSLLDFGVLYYRCCISELLQHLGETNPSRFSFHPPLIPSTSEGLEVVADEKEKIQVMEVRELQAKPLLWYLQGREIPLEVANKYCKEVEFELYQKRHVAIGFKNNSGGYELRNEYFKGSSSPKDSTLLCETNSPVIVVFEGFFSFLSYQSLLQKEAQKLGRSLAKVHPSFWMLNSLSFFEKGRAVMEKHASIHLYLDRDKAGIKATKAALMLSIQNKDQSHQYRQYKDLNEYLIRGEHPHKQQFKQNRRLK